VQPWSRASGCAATTPAYYRDSIPGWAALVALREHEEQQEVEHLKRVRRLVGAEALRGRLLSVGCGTGGFNAVATAAGAYMVGVDEEPRRLRSAGCAKAPDTLSAPPPKRCRFATVPSISSIASRSSSTSARSRRRSPRLRA
jgi:hypothetical protein